MAPRRAVDILAKPVVDGTSVLGRVQAVETSNHVSHVNQQYFFQDNIN